MKIIINRTKEDAVQTLGGLRVFDGGQQIFECNTLELPWKNNQRRVSRIPDGVYVANKHKSPKFGESIHIRDVENRSEILIHYGNYNRNTLGCVLVGENFADIDGDGHLDVTNSRQTMKELYDIVPDDLVVEIKNSLVEA